MPSTKKTSASGAAKAKRQRAASASRGEKGPAAQDSNAMKRAMAVIDDLYSAHSTGPQPATTAHLHWWGQFSADLPRPFGMKQGGHKYHSAGDRAEATALIEKLRAFLFASWPGTKEWAGEGWYRWMLPDGRQMTLKCEARRRR